MEQRIATAEWADPALVEEKYLYRDGEVWLGRSASDHLVPLGFCDDRHVCLVSGSRGGKGTSSIVNNLILWPGSVFVIDPKGENATITAARRGKGSSYSKGLGQAVQVLDPFKTAQVDDSLRGRFNPLDALDPENDDAIDEAGRIADAVVVIRESNDPFWDESARAMVKGLLLHVLTDPEYEGRRNLITVRNLILRGDWEAVDALRAAGETSIPPAHRLLWAGLINNPAFGGLVAGIGDSFTNMLLNSPKQYESVLQVANRNTEFIDSPGMQRCLEASDFQLSDLKTRPGGQSVYLCLPQMYMSTHYRWLRMMIALTVTEMEKVRGRPATGYPVLMVLDEFAGLQRMEVIENAVAQIAGYGVKLFFVLQSLEQLKAVYKDNWETFLANSGLKLFFNLEDNFSREYVSKLIGETEIMRDVKSASDSVSESRSVSSSVTRSLSKTLGRSFSRGTSESEGTNSSVSTGKSWGVNSSETSSRNTSFVQGMIFKHFDKRIGLGGSQSHGKSVGGTEGQSSGTSRGTSRSLTDGTSESATTGTNETEGWTLGTSQSRTAGMSETIQKRALITPDEIGQVFARIDDRADQAYPGLALAVISGARPVALRRVNYYEDFRFMGLFDPAPDYPFSAPKELCVDGKSIGPLFISLFKSLDLSITEWHIKAGETAISGEAAAAVGTKDGSAAARITVPRNGMVVAVPGQNSAIPEGPLFSMMYYEDGATILDPFSEVTEYFGRYRTSLEKRESDLKRSIRKKTVRIISAAVVLGLPFAIAESFKGSGIIVALALAAYFVFVMRKGAELKKVRHDLRKFSEPAFSPEIAQAASPPPALTEPAAAIDINSATEPHPPDIATIAAPALSDSNDHQGPAMDQSSSAEHGEPAQDVSCAESPASPALETPPVPQSENASSGETAVDTPEPSVQRSIQDIPPDSEGSSAVEPQESSLSASAETATNQEGQQQAADVPVEFAHAACRTGVEKRKAPDRRLLVRVLLGFVAALAAVALAGLLLRAKQNFTLAYALTGHAHSVEALAFDPHGHLLASGSGDETIKVWNVATRKELRTLGSNRGGGARAVLSVAFSPDGHQLASGSRDSTIELWDVATGKQLHTFTGLPDWVEAMAFGPDGRELAAAGGDMVKVWDVDTERELHSLSGGGGRISALVFSPDGQNLVVGNYNGTVKFLELANGREVGMVAADTHDKVSLALSPDGRELATGSGKIIKLWDVSTRKQLHTLGSKEEREISGVAFSPDGRQLVAGNYDGAVEDWELGTWRRFRPLMVSNDNVSSVAFSPDGEWLAAGYQSGSVVRLWKRK